MSRRMVRELLSHSDVVQGLGPDLTQAIERF